MCGIIWLVLGLGLVLWLVAHSWDTDQPIKTELEVIPISMLIGLRGVVTERTHMPDTEEMHYLTVVVMTCALHRLSDLMPNGSRELHLPSSFLPTMDSFISAGSIRSLVGLCAVPFNFIYFLWGSSLPLSAFAIVSVSQIYTLIALCWFNHDLSFSV